MTLVLAVLQAATDTAVQSPLPAAPLGIARFTGLLGIAAIIGVAYLLSSDRKAVKWRTVGIGLALQFVFAFFVLIAVLIFRPSGLLGERVSDRA